MSVPLFTLPDSTKQLIQDGFDTMIEVLGRECKLVLDGDHAQCPNCVFDGSARKSSGAYNGTGPRPFTRPPCPVCKGTGFDPATQDRLEYRTFSIRRNLKPSQVFPPGTLTRPVTLARIKGYVTDMPLVMQAKHVVLDHKNALYTNERYKKVSEAGPTGNIINGRYFICYLQREE